MPDGRLASDDLSHDPALLTTTLLVSVATWMAMAPRKVRARLPAIMYRRRGCRRSVSNSSLISLGFTAPRRPILLGFAAVRFRNTGLATPDPGAHAGPRHPATPPRHACVAGHPNGLVVTPAGTFSRRSGAHTIAFGQIRRGAWLPRAALPIDKLSLPRQIHGGRRAAETRRRASRRGGSSQLGRIGGAIWAVDPTSPRSSRDPL
jgi:hypothetical protein